jgi:hypothetical protein
VTRLPHLDRQDSFRVDAHFTPRPIPAAAGTMRATSSGTRKRDAPYVSIAVTTTNTPRLSTGHTGIRRRRNRNTPKTAATIAR